MDPQKYLTKCVKRKAGQKGEPATANKKKQCITYLNDEVSARTFPKLDL